MSASKPKLSRRNFLLAVGASGAAGAAALAARPAQQSQAAAGGEDKKNTRGYQATDHVRNYYRTAKV